MASVESHSNAANCSSLSSWEYFVDAESQLDDTVRACRSRHNDEFVVAMKEDLAEWLNTIHSQLALTAEDFFDQLETGVVLCRHANVVVTSSPAAGPGDPMRSSTGDLTERDGMAMTSSSISPAKRLTKGQTYN